MAQSDPAYTLGVAELAAVRPLLKAQQIIGQNGAPSPSYDAVKALFTALDWLSLAYPTVSNAAVKGWTDGLYTALTNTDTTYGCKLPCLYVAYHYGEYVPTAGGIGVVPDGALKPYPPDDKNNHWLAFAWGLWVAYPTRENRYNKRFLQSWRDWGQALGDKLVPAAPEQPPTWKAAVDGVFSAWGNTPPANLIDRGLGEFGLWPRIIEFEKKLVSTNWTDFEKVKANTASIVASQAQSVRSLLATPNLTTDAYLYLLHALIGLASGDSANQTLAQRIVSAPADSTEYPNDTFINQLVYLALLVLADPMGEYRLSNQQSQDLVQGLSDAVVGQGPASLAIKASLDGHKRVLFADSSYPMQDPYSPGIGFNQRRTDTLFALDKARASLNH